MNFISLTHSIVFQFTFHLFTKILFILFRTHTFYLLCTFGQISNIIIWWVGVFLFHDFRPVLPLIIYQRFVQDQNVKSLVDKKQKKNSQPRSVAKHVGSIFRS